MCLASSSTFAAATLAPRSSVAHPRNAVFAAIVAVALFAAACAEDAPPPAPLPERSSCTGTWQLVQAQSGELTPRNLVWSDGHLYYDTSVFDAATMTLTPAIEVIPATGGTPKSLGAYW